MLPIEIELDLEAIISFGILKDISEAYVDLGIRVGLQQSEIDNCFKQSFMNTRTTCIHIIDSWINKGGHGPKYPNTWKGLYDLLCDIGYKKTANKFSHLAH